MLRERSTHKHAYERRLGGAYTVWLEDFKKGAEYQRWKETMPSRTFWVKLGTKWKEMDDEEKQKYQNIADQSRKDSRQNGAARSLAPIVRALLPLAENLYVPQNTVRIGKKGLVRASDPQPDEDILLELFPDNCLAASSDPQEVKKQFLANSGPGNAEEGWKCP